MNAIRGMTALRSYPREFTAIGVTPVRDDVEIELGQKYGKSVIPFYYVTTDDEVPHLVEWMQRHKRIGFDTETGGDTPWAGLDPLIGKVATLQIGNPLSPDPRVYVLDLRCLSAEALVPVLEILGSYNTKKLGQNVRFEYKFLRTNTGVMCRNLEDTQLNEQVIRTGLFRGASGGDDGEGRSRAAYKHTSMDALCSFYLGIKIDKDQQLRTSFYSTPPGKHSVRQRLYAGGDVVYPFYVAQEQQAELDARQLGSIARLEHSIIPSLGEAELRGMYIDQDAWRALWQEALANLLDARTRLDALFLGVQGDLFNGGNSNVRPIYLKSRKSPPLNWGSSEQVKWAITQYCKAIGWHHEIVTTYERLLEIKEKEGAEWRARQVERGREVKVEDTPDWLIPEGDYCILLKAEKEQLIIRACREQLPWELVDPLSDYSKYAKRVGTYGLKFLEKNVRKDTKRFHFDLHQCITTTGRLSATPNSMNLPNDKRYRACYKASPGKKLVLADYSSVEPRITAFVSRDPVYCATFLAGDDLYITSAEHSLGYRPNKHEPEGAFQRQLSKVRVLSLAYNMGLMKYRDRLTLAVVKDIRAGKMPAPSVEFAREQYDGFFEVHPGVEEWQMRMADLADPKKSSRKIWDSFLNAEVTWIEAPCGRKRFFPPDAKPYAEAPNVPPQSGSASMLKAAVALMQREIDQRGWQEKVYLVNTVHDEPIFEADDDVAVEAAQLLKQCMERAGNFYNGDIPIVAEFPENSVGVVPYWTKALPEQALDDSETSDEGAVEAANDILDEMFSRDALPRAA